MSNMYTRCYCLLAGYWITTMAERPGHEVRVKTQKVKMTNGNVQANTTAGLLQDCHKTINTYCKKCHIVMVDF